MHQNMRGLFHELRVHKTGPDRTLEGWMDGKSGSFTI